MLIHRKEVLDIIPCLQEDTEDAVVLVARGRRQTLGNLPLQHTRAERDALPIVQHTKKDLRRNIVWVIPNKTKGEVSSKVFLNGDTQEVPLDNASF